MAEFDVLVIGAGHAGCEAALAAARMGLRTGVTTLRRDRLLPGALGGSLASERMVDVEKAILRALGVPVE